MCSGNNAGLTEYLSMNPDNYLTLKKHSRGIYRDRGSRFIGLAWPVDSVEPIREIVDSVRKEYHDARHHCYAYMIGADRLTWRVNDDGEPSGSAGKPILGQINSAGLTNVLIVVVRYFGGTLLGVSGLIHAYRTAAAEAIKNSGIITMTLMDYFRLSFPYAAMNDVMRILKEENAGQTDQSFGLDCSITIQIPHSEAERITGRLCAVSEVSTAWLSTR